MPGNLIREAVQYPMSGYVLNGFYYGMILIGVLVVLRGTYSRLMELNYNPRTVKKFILIVSAAIYPALILSGRIASMFYYPFEVWSFSFFYDQLINGHFITFHSGFILPFIFLPLLAKIMNIKIFQLMDAMLLYVPLGHAIGRVGCLVVGCCWGGEISFNLFGYDLNFHNPVPLYSIIINTALFFVLKKVYATVYFGEDKSGPFNGIVASLYFILYGNSRLIIEIFRKEIVLIRGLSQAQIVMAVFISVGIVLLLWILLTDRFADKYKENELSLKKRYLASLIGCVITYFIVILIANVLLSSGIIKWPFRGIQSAADLYGVIGDYSPVMIVAAVLLLWLRNTRESVMQYFVWKRPSGIFILTLVLSAAYAVYMLMRADLKEHSFSLWIPIIILSAINALSEEIIYRVAFYRLLRGVIGGVHMANAIQSGFYSIVHWYIGGGEFAALSFIYGLLLGYIVKRDDSVLPAIICHFVIDIAFIGLPVLSY